MLAISSKPGSDGRNFRFSAVLLAVLVAIFSTGAFGQVNFEPPAFTTGVIHNQNGWKSLGAAGSGCATYDHQVTTNVGAPASFGTQSLRISNAVTSGCFSDQTFSPSIANEAGETIAVNGGLSGGTRQNKFISEFRIASAVPGAQQPGLFFSVSPDRGDGARMSYVGFDDQADGIHVIFYDYQDVAPFGTFLGDPNGKGVGDGFVFSDIATLDRSLAHTIRFEMDFVNGYRNDVVRIYVNGVLVKTGTSWEDYFRFVEGQETRTVDSLIFRTGGTAVPANLNKGFLIDGVDNVSTTNIVNVTPANYNGWLVYNDENDTINNALGTFKIGPGTPPMGIGGMEISVTGTQRRNLATYQFSGTPLANITELSFDTYNPSAGNGGSASRSAFLVFNVDFNGTDTWQRRLVFVPSVNGTVLQNTWQTWDALNGGNALWSYSGATWPMGFLGGGEPGTSTKTWNQILSQYPGVRIRVTDAHLGLRVGEPYADGYTENLDRFKFGTTTGGTTLFNFDPVVPTVTINQAVAPQTDPTSTSPVNFTVTFSEPMTGFTSSDVSLGGTAGATTAVVSGGPSTYNVAVSGMTSTGTVIATVPAGGAQAVGSGASNAASTSTDNTVTFYTCNNVSIATGQTTLRNAALTIPITTNSMTGQEVYSYDFTYTFNPSTLTYTGYSTAGTLSSGFTMTVHSPAAGVLVFSGFGSTPLSGAGTLLNVNFTASGPIGSTSNLTLSPFTLNEGVPCANVTNGDITIISGTVDGTVTYLNSNGNAPNPRFVAGVNLNAPGTPPVSGTTNGSGFYSLSSFGNSAYTVTPSKSPVAWNDPLNGITANDAARIAQHVVGVLPLNPNPQLAADVSNNGSITSFDSSIIARFVVNIPVAGVTGTWRFQPTSRTYTVTQLETGQTAQDYSAILMGDVTGNWNSTGALWENLTDFERDQAIEVAMPEMTAGSGSEIVVPVRAGDTTGKGVISYQFELRYDPQVLDAGKTPCTAADTLSSTMTVTCNAEEPGIVRVAVFGVNDLLGKGELLRLKFSVTGEANSFSNLELVGFKFNESFPFGVARNGRVTVTEAAPSDSIGGRVLTSTGEPVGQARVTVTDQNGNARTMTTNNFGNFRFAGLVNGGTYTVEVAARGLRFTPRSIVVGPNAGSVDITAEP